MFKVDSKRIISVIVMVAMITGIFSAINPTNVYAGAVYPITSTIYAIDHQNHIIGEVEEEKVTVDTFTSGIVLSDGYTLSVYESDGTTLKTGKIRNGDKVKVTKGSDAIVYTLDTYKYVDDFVEGEKTYVGNLVDIGAEKSYADGDDGASDAINLGFDFGYFNNSYSKAYLDINGFLSFDEKLLTYRKNNVLNCSDWSNWGFDGTNLKFNFIGAFIDDIMMTPNGSSYSPSILCKTIGVEGHRKFIVQWTNMYFWNTPFQFGDVQAILFEDSDEIQVQYRRLFNNESSNRGLGSNASVGLKGINNVVYRDYTKPEYADKLLSQGQAIRFKPNASGSYDIDDHAEYINVFLLNSGAPSVAYIDDSNNATADKAVINSTEPVLRWSESTGVQKYKLIVSDDKQFSNIIHNIDNGLEKSFKFGGNYPLEYDKTYYWIVKSINSLGEVISPIYSFKIVKVDQLAPTGLTGVAPSVYGGSDGKITGITSGSAIEYKLSTDTSSYLAATGTEITGLVSGTYYVRYAKTAELGAGLDATVVVPEGTIVKQPYTVTGSIKDENNADVSDATVKIMSGSQQIALTTTKNSGNFSMSAIPNGTYNLVISKGTDQTITLSITVSNNDVAIGTVILPNGKKNSVLEVKGENTPKIVVDGLNKYFNSGKITDDEEDFVESGGIIEIKLTADEKSESNAQNAAEIRNLAGNKKTIGVFLDLSLNKIVTTGSAITSGSALTGTFRIEELDDVLSIYIPLPTELQGKSDYVIYRYHGNGVDTITTTATPEGEKIVVSADLKSITLYTKKFSTYAIAYTAATNNNNDRDNDDHVDVPVIVESDNKVIIRKDVEKSALPYYMQDGEKIFIGFAAKSEDALKYIAPNGKTVQFEKNPKYFSDIENHWAKGNIDFVTEHEIFMGTDKNIFSPNIGMTRAMFVTAVGRLYERSYGSIKGNNTFSDVDKNAYYADYVAWANENGIIEGIGDNKFAPDIEVTREQMAEIMFRFAKLIKKAPQGAWMINITYPDKADISAWANESAAYCQLTSIISGRDDGKFAPKSTATRAEVSAVIERFVNEILK